MDPAHETVSVLAVLALLAICLWTLRRSPASGWRAAFAKRLTKDRSIETVERMALTPQHSLHLVRINGRELLVATHPQGCALLLETRKGHA